VNLRWLSDGADEAFPLQVQNYLLCCLFRSQLCGVDHDLGIFWFFVGIGNSGEFLQYSGSRLGIQSLAVAFFAVLQGRCQMHQNPPNGSISPRTCLRVAS
jgi:hypothetical protein